MQCPHCSKHFYENWYVHPFRREADCLVSETDTLISKLYWLYRSAVCPCGKPTIELSSAISSNRLGPPSDGTKWERVYPIGASRGPVSKDVPTNISNDYIEACNVLPVSPKASAALSRRCLQNILHNQGYKAKDLAKEIDALLNEADPRKAIPIRLRDAIDGIRNFGNFSAHPIDDKTTLQIIDVEPHEAEWCLEILEEMFEHFYVGPALAKRKKDALNAKLTAAGKPPAK